MVNVLGFVLAFSVFHAAEANSFPRFPVEKMVIVTLGLNADDEIATNIKSQLEQKFSIPITIEKKLEESAQLKAELKSSQQFFVDAFLNEWRTPVPEKSLYLIVSKHRITAKGANFLFSATHPSKPLVVVSTARFTPNIDDQVQITNSLKSQGKSGDMKLYFREVFRIIASRTVKTLMRTVGAALGLDAGPNATCVMKFSNSLPELDKKAADYCGDDLVKLKAAKLVR